MRTHVFENDNDNWYQVTDAKQRKRIQDRLAQRARRRRLAEANQNADPSTASDEAQKAPSNPEQSRSRPKSRSKPDNANTTIAPPSATRPPPTNDTPSIVRATPTPHLYCTVVSSEYVGKSDKERRAICIHKMTRDIASARRYFRNLEAIGHLPTSPPFSFGSAPEVSPSVSSTTLSSSPGSTSGASQAFTTVSTRLGLDTPHTQPSQAALAPSLGLSPIAIFSALWINGQTLGYECMGPDTVALSARENRDSPYVPPSLWPTETQCTVPHWQWIDHFPFPRFRDNIIRGMELIDCDDFLRDLFTLKSFELKEGAESWDPGAWKMVMSKEEGDGLGVWAAKWGYLFL